MEHILQFGVSIDDDAIKKICEEKAAEQITQEIMDFSKEKSYYGEYGRSSEQLKALFAVAIDKYIKEHAEEITKEAIKEIAKNMMKTKVVKESLANLVTDNTQEG